jgi:signal transduction histidine kinase
MGQTEYKIFVVLATLIILVFIGGIVVFIFQYHKKKLLHDRETEMLNEAHARELLNVKLEIQKMTMQEIGREIHDNICQQFVNASFSASKLTYNNPYTEINEQLNYIANTITTALTELRDLSRSLNQANIEHEELKDLISAQCHKVNALKMCTVTSSFNGAPLPVSPTVKTFVLRIVQEFMQNSIKHAACKNITITIDYEEQGLRIKAKDDGKGFDTTKATGKGIGLSNIRKRAEIIGADFALTSAGNMGTMLTLFIPVNKLNMTY